MNDRHITDSNSELSYANGYKPAISLSSSYAHIFYLHHSTIYSTDNDSSLFKVLNRDLDLTTQALSDTFVTVSKPKRKISNTNYIPYFLSIATAVLEDTLHVAATFIQNQKTPFNNDMRSYYRTTSSITNRWFANSGAALGADQLRGREAYEINESQIQMITTPTGVYFTYPVNIKNTIQEQDDYLVRLYEFKYQFTIIGNDTVFGRWRVPSFKYGTNTGNDAYKRVNADSSKFAYHPVVGFNKSGYHIIWGESSRNNPFTTEIHHNRLVDVIPEDGASHAITQNTYWTGQNLYLGSDNSASSSYDYLTVASGKTVVINDDAKVNLRGNRLKINGEVYIQPGVTLTPGKVGKIEVYGKLSAKGTASELISMEATSADKWDGIYFDGSSNDNSIVEYVKINHAKWGVLANSASPTIRHNTILNSTLYGIRLDYSTTSLENNSIENTISSSLGGMYLRYSDVIIRENELNNNSGNGIYLYQSDPKFFDNTISENSAYGVYCSAYSSPLFGNYDPGNNIISDNAIGVYASSYSNPVIGDLVGGSVQGGYNSITGNSSYAVYAVSNSDVAAQYNWWGSYPPSSGLFYSDGTSAIDYSNPLYYNPTSMMQNFAGTESGWEVSGKTADLRDLLRLAKKLRREKQPEQALRIYHKLIRDHASQRAGKRGLIELIATYREAGIDSAVAVLQEVLLNHPNTVMRAIAADLLTGEHLIHGNSEAAIAHAQQTLIDFPGTESEKLALYDLFSISFADLNDVTQAQNYLTQLQNKYPDDVFTQQAQEMVDSETANTMAAKPGGGLAAKLAGVNDVQPEKFDLQQNYPNPFNPTTVIRYQLPITSDVKLQIYNTLGQLVKTLVSENQPAGAHQTVWNGRNDLGEAAASGVYFYHIHAGPFSQTRKMLMLR